MKRLALLALIAATLGACSPTTENIPAQAMRVECINASAQIASALSEYAALDAEQRKARANDAVTIALTGVPAARLTGGERVKRIAEVKGTLAALAACQAAK